MISVSLPNKR